MRISTRTPVDPDRRGAAPRAAAPGPRPARSTAGGIDGARRDARLRERRREGRGRQRRPGGWFRASAAPGHASCAQPKGAAGAHRAGHAGRVAWSNALRPRDPCRRRSEPRLAVVQGDDASSSRSSSTGAPRFLEELIAGGDELLDRVRDAAAADRRARGIRSPTSRSRRPCSTPPGRSSRSA